MPPETEIRIHNKTEQKKFLHATEVWMKWYSKD
jgi:hypothetical protein